MRFRDLLSKYWDVGACVDKPLHDGRLYSFPDTPGVRRDLEHYNIEIKDEYMRGDRGTHHVTVWWANDMLDVELTDPGAIPDKVTLQFQGIDVKYRRCLDE